MCEPVSIASAAIAIGGAVMQHQAASAAAKDQNNRAATAADNARISAINEYGQLQQRELQEREAAAVQSQELSMDARKTEARALASADAAGVTGLSVDALVRDIMGQEGRGQTTIATNLDYTVNDLREQAKGVEANAKNQINSVPTARGPSMFATGLQIGGAAVSGYGDYKSGKYEPRGNPPPPKK